MKKKPTPPTILALKRPTPPTTEQPATNDAPSLPPLPKEDSGEVANHTPESQAGEPKPKIPPLVTLASTTNAAGEVFKVGDQILAKAPWGERALAEIVMIYEGSDGTWVEYKPIEQLLEGWSWERGIVMAAQLGK